MAATFASRSRAGRLGWIRRKRRVEIQATIAAELDRLRDAGHGISFFWPTGKPMDRSTIARFLYWSLVESGAVQAERHIGYEALGDTGPLPGESLTLSADVEGITDGR